MLCAPSLRLRHSGLTYRRPIDSVHAKALFIDDFVSIHNETSRWLLQSKCGLPLARCPRRRDAWRSWKIGIGQLENLVPPRASFSRRLSSASSAIVRLDLWPLGCEKR